MALDAKDSELLYKLAQQQNGLVADDEGTQFRVVGDPDARTIQVVRGGAVTGEITPDAQNYMPTLESLIKSNQSSINKMLIANQPKVEPTVIDDEKILPADALSTDASKTALSVLSDDDLKTKKGQASQATMRQAQKRDLAFKLGPAAVIGGIQAASEFFRESEADKYFAEERARLEEMREKGQMGLTAQEQRLLGETQMKPTRALTREARMRQEAERAGTGVKTSAAQQQQIREAQQRAVGEAGRKAGLTLGQADLQKSAENLRKLESLIQFESTRKEQKRANLSKALSDIGVIAGFIAGSGAASTKDVTSTIFDISQAQNKSLDTSDVVALNRRLTMSPVLSEDRFNAILKEYDLNPNLLTEEQKKIFMRE